MTEHHWQQRRATLEELSVDPKRGLDEAEVRRRRKEHGPNRLGEAETGQPLEDPADQFRNLVIGILALAAIVFPSRWANLCRWPSDSSLRSVINAAIGSSSTEWKAARARWTGRPAGLGHTVHARVERTEGEPSKWRPSNPQGSRARRCCAARAPAKRNVDPRPICGSSEANG